MRIEASAWAGALFLYLQAIIYAAGLDDIMQAEKRWR
jgi:hypothetical protein